MSIVEDRGPGTGWSTFGAERSLLVVVRTVTSLTSDDRRIQTWFTLDTSRPAKLGAGLPARLEALEAPTLAWPEAVRSRFDLTVAASENDGIERMSGPVLLVPHGAGFEKYYPGTDVVAGMDPTRLVVAGRLVPAAIGLSHADQRALLQRVCPPAVPRSHVIGDPTLDRMLASRHRAASFAARLDARGRKLVVVGSTFGPDSLLGASPELPDRLAAQLPVDEYRIVMLPHPGVWAHGPWQVRAWLSRAAAAGVLVLGPDQAWQAALVAADCVISDHGSTSLYAAALGKPVLLAGRASATTVAGSATSALRTVAGVLDADGDLRGQIEAVCDDRNPDAISRVAGLAIQHPGQAAHRLRTLMYELMRLEVPAEPADSRPYPLPVVSATPIGALVAAAGVRADEVAVVRHPDLPGEPDARDYRHLVVDSDTAALGQVAAAAVLCLPIGPRWPAMAAELLRRWPAATLVAGVVDARTCRIRTREREVLLAAPIDADEVDPMVLASLAYVRLRPHDRLLVGGRVYPVTVTDWPAGAG